jgi:hypothetical protein
MVDIKYPTGTNDGLLKPFADDPPMYSRVGGFSSFSGSNSYNIVWGGTSSANTDYEDNHILIHNIKIVNTDDDNDTTTIYFYHDNDTTSANARAAKSLLFYIALNGVQTDAVPSVVNIPFPIPLIVRNGCRVAASRVGPLVDVCYTVLNNSNTLDWYNDLQYRYLTGASAGASAFGGDGTGSGPTGGAQTPIDVHPNFGRALTVDTLSTVADHITATYPDVALSGGTGYGAKATVVVNSTGASGPPQLGAVASVTITAAGDGYTINDSLTINNATIGGAANATCDIATVTPITTDVQLWGGFVNNSAVEINDDYSRAIIRNGGNSTRAISSMQMNQHATTDQSAANTNTDDGVVWYPYPVHLKNGMKIYHDDDDLRSVWFYRPVKQSGITYDQFGD